MEVTSNNILQVLDVYQSLDTSTKGFINLHIKQLLGDTPVRVYNNNSLVDSFANFIPNKTEVQTTDDVICERLCKLIDDLKGYRPTYTTFAKKIIKTPVMSMSDLNDVLGMCFDLCEIVENSIQSRDFIFTEIIPFKLYDFDIISGIQSEWGNIQYHVTWSRILDCLDYTDDDHLKTLKYLVDSFSFILSPENAEKFKKVFQDFGLITLDEIDTGLDFDFSIEFPYDFKNAKNMPELSKKNKVISLANINKILNKVFKRDDINTSFFIPSDELCYLRKDIGLLFNGSWKYQEGMNPEKLKRGIGFDFVLNCEVDGKKYILFTIKNKQKTPSVMGIYRNPTDPEEISLLQIDTEKGKYYFDEFR